jgi:hypothetical protein
MGTLTPSLRKRFLEELHVERISAEFDMVAELPAGPEIAIESWQDHLVEMRLESLGKPGVYLDRSPTGSGKSTADIEALRKAGRGLVVLETHDQCKEAETDLSDAGLDAVAYRGRFTEGEDQNCWNEEADKAEEMGFSPATAVCVYCEFRNKCVGEGYIAQTEAARQAQVSIATHARAIYTGLEALAKGRNYIAVHEDVHTVLVSSKRISLQELRNAAEMLDRVLNEPRWLDRFGDVWDVDDPGTRIKDEVRSRRRDRVYEYSKYLVCLIEDLIDKVTEADTSQKIAAMPAVPKPAGIERLLFLATCNFKTFAPWRSLLAIATGKTHRIGVIVRAKHKRTCRDGAEPAAPSDDVAF